MTKFTIYSKVHRANPEPGIRMKVLRNGGQLLDDHGMDPTDEDEFQNLIVIRHNPNKGGYAKCLRLLFLGLMSLSIASILFIIIKDYTQMSWLMQAANSSHMLNLHHLETFSGNTTPNYLTSSDTCLISDEWKFDCHPAKDATADECLQRGCCWKPLESHSKPWCYYPSGFSYFTFTDFVHTKRGLKGSAISTRKSPYPDDVKDLDVDIIYETEDIVRIRITDSKSKRFEVPLNYKTYDKRPAILNYSVVTTRDGIQVFRYGEKTPVFDTTIAPLVYSNQFIEISTTLQTQYLYGIGESVDSLKRSVNGSRYVLYNHDGVPRKDINNYGSHPFYMVMDKMGRSYGVFLANSNAMEITVQPAPSLTFRTIGGIIDLRIFVGPKPRDVTDQYTSVIGRPMIPPYWSLGFHLCRFNYGTVNHTAEILENNLKAGLPIDVQWNDLDYMHHANDFTYDPIKFAGLPEFIDSLNDRGMRYVLIIDPGISSGEARGKYTPYDMGAKMDIFIKNSKGRVFEGKVWNKKSTVWPDFSHPNITEYWMYQLDLFRKRIKFDGAWIDMNEPSNFWNGESEKDGCVKNSSLDNPPYVPRVVGNSLFDKTICPSAQQAGGHHYDLHNLYGIQETIATHKALGDITNERSFIISRSTFPGQGRFGGHWTGDVESTWEDLRQTIPQILTFGLFGIPMVGADICGFNKNTTVDLCKRWHQLGAFYPFSRNHNTDDGIPQDPWSMGPEVFLAAETTLKIRYELLPYIYSLFFRSHLSGLPVARPLFFEFPKDVFTFGIDTQFMLGKAVMVVPILEENYTKSTISAYLPKGFWYQHGTGEVIESLGEQRDLTIPEHSIPVLYQGGSIVIKQEGAQNTVKSRKNKFRIEVFLSADDTADGEFFWDDGVSNFPKELVQYNQYSFKVSKNVLSMTKVFDGYDSSKMILGEIIVRGVRARVNSALLNNVEYPFQFDNKILTLNNMTLQGPSGWTDGLTLVWS